MLAKSDRESVYKQKQGQCGGRDYFLDAWGIGDLGDLPRAYVYYRQKLGQMWTLGINPQSIVIYTPRPSSGRATTPINIIPPAFQADMACERGRRLLGSEGNVEAEEEGRN